MPLSPLIRISGCAIATFVLSLISSSASAQVVMYQTYRPVPVAVAPSYVANYSPVGSYAAVTAYSPPVVSTVPSSSVAVTSYYAPSVSAVPVTSYYAPTVASPVTTTAYYAPAPVVTPVAAYYAPTAMAVPVYRRGLFGRYRPARAAYYYPY
ncbi:MAG: hypothetical protein ABGW78_10990 [Pirellulales bacterium]